jgi:hypothetical protein
MEGDLENELAHVASSCAEKTQNILKECNKEIRVRFSGTPPSPPPVTFKLPFKEPLKTL